MLFDPIPCADKQEQWGLSKRGEDFYDFALSTVIPHIEQYTIPQYGDAPDDPVEEWTAQDCVRAIAKYAARFGKNSRDGQDGLDLIKIAHFAQLAFIKL
jgi:hypothetical protein